MAIPGFEYREVEADGSTYVVGLAGQGPPVLLLHGFPENQYCWRKVAPALSRARAVVLCDLKGYGLSRAPAGGPLGEGYSKRELAAELVLVMGGLGFERFSVVGHDRGGRVAYRLALDSPAQVERVCVLNVVPTVDQFERMSREPALDFYPWLFLAQPPPFAERLVTASADYFLRHTLAEWTTTPGAIEADAIDVYLSTFTSRQIASICAEYRAAFHFDRQLDAADRAAGRRIECPVLVLWGADDMSDPLPTWRRWGRSVEGGPLPGGHFVPEEAPEELTSSLERFLPTR